MLDRADILRRMEALSYLPGRYSHQLMHDLLDMLDKLDAAENRARNPLDTAGRMGDNGDVRREKKLSGETEVDGRGYGS